MMPQPSENPGQFPRRYISRINGQRTFYDWESVDWSQPNYMIAEQLGCHTTCVSRARSFLRKPRSPYRRRKQK